MFNKYIPVVAIMLGLVTHISNINAQTIVGPSVAFVGPNHYTADYGYGYPQYQGHPYDCDTEETIELLNWNAPNNVTLSNLDCFSVDVVWPSEGQYLLEYEVQVFGSYSYTSLEVTVIQQPSFFLSTNFCGAKTLTRSGNSSNMTWYWQGTNSNGTDTSPAAASLSYTANSTGTYWLRGKNNDTGAWLDVAVPYFITVNPSPVVPNVSVSTNTCGDMTLFRGTPPSGVVWYWQGTDPNGISTSSSASSVSVNSSGTYFIRAQESAHGCWSDAVGTPVVVSPTPANPVMPSISSNVCGPKTLTRSTPPSGITWYWQGANPNNSINDPEASATTYVLTGDQFNVNYYIKAQDNTSGCWSGATSISVTALYVPPQPPVPSVSTNICGTKTLTHNTPPSGEGATWYWQGTNSNGTSTSSGTNIDYAFSSGTYYLRAKSNTSECWSDAVGVTVAIQEPDNPPVPTVSSNSCGPKILTHATPPAGVTYYWQGANSFNEVADVSSSTYVVTGSQNNINYYLKARDNSGCWSSYSSVSVTVVDPAPPSSTSLSFCEWDAMNLTTTGYPSGGNLKWYNASDQFQYTGITYPTNLSFGNYNYHVKSVNSDGCEGSSYSLATVNVTSCDTYINWTEDISYGLDGSNNTIEVGHSKNYFDGFGNPLQSQGKNYTANQVLASQPVNNSFNVPAISTLAAPINSSDFSYRHKFVTNANHQRYNASDFDQGAILPPGSFVPPGFIDNPLPVNNDGIGTLGWYYSNSNTIEPLTPITNYPYTRSYSPPSPDPTTNKSTGPGDAYKMGGGHEVINERQLLQSSELSHYIALRPQLVPNSTITYSGTIGYKYISTNPDGKKVVSFMDAEGRSLASATLTNGTYDNWSYSYYNDLGQVVATVAPKGVIIGDLTAPKFTTLYTYDYLGRVIETTSPDEGTSRFVYSTDGKIRFSQNQIQHDATPQRFSYTNYDYAGRLIEAGEYTSSGTNPYIFEASTVPSPATYSILNLVDIDVPCGKDIESITTTDFPALSQKFDNVRCADYSFIKYDVQASDFPTGDTDHPQQNNLFGEVSKTQNANATTWYSYDEFGQLEWSKQSLPLPQSAQWTNIVNVNVNGNTLAKTSADGWGTGAAFSVQAIPASMNGWVEFTAGETNTFKLMGLSTTDDNASYTRINYAFNMSTNGSLQVYEYGALVVTVGTYTTTDILRVERVGSGIVYKKNGVILYSSNLPAFAALYADCAFYNLNSSIKNISIGGGSNRFKTVDYTYDYNGNVTQTVYQKNQTDAFYHFYTYDADQRLSKVEISLDGTAKALQAKYYYYLHGPLKRVELGNAVQGIDYVYSIDGSLKLINNADPSLDPGQDGITGANAGFMKDVFGETLDYNAADYAGASYSEGNLTLNTTSYPEQFGGLIKAARWHSAVDNHNQQAYAYTYDKLNQLDNADWGSISGSAGSYGFTISPSQAYKEDIAGYDNNGNITGMVRKGKTGNSLANYSYVYQANTNKLNQVAGGTSPINYQYNNIGQMTQQSEGTKTMNVSYNAYGLVKEIRNASNYLLMSYTYDDRGTCIQKTTYSGTSANTTIRNTYYVSDVSGNTLAIYEQNIAAATPLQLIEVPVYGGGRVALYKPFIATTLYEVSDHLGNVRGVIGVPSTQTYCTNLEAATNSTFKNYTHSNFDLVDHTDAGTTYTYAQLLNGGNNSQVGLSKSLVVSPGDKVKVEVYAKYLNLGSTNSNLVNFAAALTSAFSLSAGGVGDPALAYNAVNNYGASLANSTGRANTSSLPKAFATILLFDRNYNFVDAAWKQLDGDAEQIGTTKTPHQYIDFEVPITQPGYAYIFLSNENPTQVDVYFDDFTLTHTQSPIVAGSDFYPFGLAMENREITDEKYRYGYQGQYSEKNDSTRWNEFDLRMYDARVGRWLTVDPYGQFDSPYLAMGNNPVSGTDPDGGWCCGWAWISPTTLMPGYWVQTATNAEIALSMANATVAVGKAVVNNTGTFYGGLNLLVTNNQHPLIFSTEGWIRYGTPEHYNMSVRSAEAIGNAVIAGAETEALGGVLSGGKYLYKAIRSTSKAVEVTLKVAEGDAKAATEGGTKLLTQGAKALHKHHVFPQQYRKWFASRGIKNIDDYAVQISQSTHLKGVHGSGIGNLPGKWNQLWGEFIKANPDATASDIFHHAEGLLQRFGLEHLPYVPY